MFCRVIKLNVYTQRSDGRETNEFSNGLEIFMYQTGNTLITQETGKMFCPCRKWKNTKITYGEIVLNHLVNIIFTPNYYIWFKHGKIDVGNEDINSITNFRDVGNCEEPNHLHNENSYNQKEQMVDHDRFYDMVINALLETKQ